MEDYPTWEKLQILDGGFGTELELTGFNVQNDVLWSAAALIDRPDLVVETHRRFIKAGCDIILTNSYQASISLMMTSRGMTKATVESYLKSSVLLAQQAVKEYADGRKVLVVGSVGAYGASLCDGSEYTGRYVDEVVQQVLVDYHVQQTVPLLEAGLKIIAYETVPSYKEAVAILKAADRTCLPYKFWISFSCQDQTRTNHNEPFGEVVRKISYHPQLLGIGINCTSPDCITPLLESCDASNSSLPFIVYPNSGEIYNSNNKTWGSSCCNFPTMEQLTEWKRLNVKVVGGCCRVTAEMIKELSILAATMSP